MTTKKFTVIGAGNGGKAMAAYLATVMLRSSPSGEELIWKALPADRMVLARSRRSPMIFKKHWRMPR